MLKCITDALVRVAETVQRFMAEPEVRFVHIVTTDSLRLAVLEHIAAMEHHRENYRPIYILEAPVESNDDGWQARIEELRDDMNDLRERLSEADPEVVVDAMPAQAKAKTALGAFGLELGGALQCLHEPFGGLIIVLSPFWVKNRARWIDDVKALVRLRTLVRVRWVVVDLDVALCKTIADELGNQAIVVDARLSDSKLASEMSTMTTLSESAPDGAMGYRLAGCAGPDEPPPPRKEVPAPLTPGQAGAFADVYNVPAATMQVKPMHELRKLIMGASTAMTRGDAGVAVNKMRDARNAAQRMGLERIAVMLTLMMGGYAMQARAPETATTIFEEGRLTAEKAKMPDLAAQAQMSMAAGLLAMGKHSEAALAYAQAGQRAAEAGIRVLAIEAYRICGEILAKANDLDRAAQAFSRACAIANDAEPSEKQLSSAPEATRELAALFYKHDMADTAEHLEHVAEEMEMNIPDEIEVAHAC